MEADLAMVVKLVLSLLFGGVLVFLAYIYNALFVKPKRLRSTLEKQGISGPSPSFLLGNIPEMRRIIQTQSMEKASSIPGEKDAAIHHDWPHTVFSYLYHWMDEYGPSFMYSSGNVRFLFITDTETVKEVSLCTSLSLGKPSYLSKDRGPLLGLSIMSTSGPIWAHQRKIIAPEFYVDRVKGMVSLMVDCTTSMLGSWEDRIESDGGMAEINVDPDMRILSADVISRACFGSNYAKGKEIFLKLRTLQNAMSKVYAGVPGLRHLPTKTNREIWKLEKEINSMILRVIKQRTAETARKDLLQMILEGAKAAESYRECEGLPGKFSLDKFMVDNCKAIYFAGQETTAITASWSLMLLASHPEWQAHARAEVLEICGDNLPDAQMLQKMETLTMVIQETLRLYPPAVFMIREAFQDIKFKDIIIPKGMIIQIPIPIIQQDPNTWGPDAHLFNPERFANGVLGSSQSPRAYMPFGGGPRICTGQHFAMAELKVILALVLSKFSFSLSPAYRHSPAFKLVVEPGNGVRLHIKKLS